MSVIGDERNRAVQMLRTFALIHERAIPRSSCPDEHRGALQALIAAADALEKGAHDQPMFDEPATLRDVDADGLAWLAAIGPSAGRG